jgi:hypothetical protein
MEQSIAIPNHPLLWALGTVTQSGPKQVAIAPTAKSSEKCYEPTAILTHDQFPQKEA